MKHSEFRIPNGPRQFPYTEVFQEACGACLSTLQFGVSTHLYHDHRLGRDHLVEIAAHGFEAVEIFANRPHVELGDEAGLVELDEALRDTALRVHAVHAPIAESLRGGVWGTPISIAAGDERARAQAVDEVGAAIGLAHRVGAGFVVVHVGVPEAQLRGSADNRPDAARRSLQALAAVAGPRGVRLAIELIPNRLSTAEQLVRWIEDELELPDIGVCLDFGHAQLAGDLVDAIETLSGHIVTTHVHDNGGRSDDHLVPFEGRIDWEAGMMALQKVGYEGVLVYELAAAADPRTVLERAQRASERLQRLATF
jgi:sugar phosphate isomerase/epimerase